MDIIWYPIVTFIVFMKAIHLEKKLYGFSRKNQRNNYEDEEDEYACLRCSQFGFEEESFIFQCMITDACNALRGNGFHPR